MKRNIFRRNAFDVLKSLLVPIFFTLVVMGMIMYGLGQTQESSKSEGRRILEESIRRAIIVNYSVEGNYPESIAEIESKYGVYIDRTRYIVHYSIFASNIMPDMTVFELAG